MNTLGKWIASLLVFFVLMTVARVAHELIGGRFYIDQFVLAGAAGAYWILIDLRIFGKLKD
jgi:hypothetical protein